MSLSCKSITQTQTHTGGWSGGILQPEEVLECLPEEAPLATVQRVLQALLAERTHCARQGTLMRSLRRADSLAAAATRAEVWPPFHHVSLPVIGTFPNSLNVLITSHHYNLSPAFCLLFQFSCVAAQSDAVSKTEYELELRLLIIIAF